MHLLGSSDHLRDVRFTAPCWPQTLALYGSWRRAQRMPGGQKMVRRLFACTVATLDELKPLST